MAPVGSLSHPQHYPLISCGHKVQLGKFTVEVVFTREAPVCCPAVASAFLRAPSRVTALLWHSLSAVCLCVSFVATLPLAVLVRGSLLLLLCMAVPMLFLHTWQWQLPMHCLPPSRFPYSGLALAPPRPPPSLPTAAPFLFIWLGRAAPFQLAVSGFVRETAMPMWC